MVYFRDIINSLRSKITNLDSAKNSEFDDIDNQFRDMLDIVYHTDLPNTSKIQGFLTCAMEDISKIADQTWVTTASKFYYNDIPKFFHDFGSDEGTDRMAYNKSAALQALKIFKTRLEEGKGTALIPQNYKDAIQAINLAISALEQPVWDGDNVRSWVQLAKNYLQIYF